MSCALLAGARLLHDCLDHDFLLMVVAGSDLACLRLVRWLDVLNGGGLGALDVDLASWGTDVHRRTSSHVDLLAGRSDADITFVHHDSGLAGMDLDPGCIDSGADVLAVRVDLDPGLGLVDGEARLLHIDVGLGLPDDDRDSGTVDGRDILLLNDDLGDGRSDLEGLMLGHDAFGIFRIVDDLGHACLHANDAAIIRVVPILGIRVLLFFCFDFFNFDYYFGFRFLDDRLLLAAAAEYEAANKGNERENTEGPPESLAGGVACGSGFFCWCWCWFWIVFFCDACVHDPL